MYTARVLAWALAKKYGADNAYTKRLQGLTSPLVDTRMVLRLVGILGSTHDILVNTETDPVLRPISVAQAWSMILYYPLENIYWFGAHGVVPMSEDTQNAFSVWSSRAWLVYILLDFLADGYRLQGKDLYSFFLLLFFFYLSWLISLSLFVPPLFGSFSSLSSSARVEHG